MQTCLLRLMASWHTILSVCAPQHMVRRWQSEQVCLLIILKHTVGSPEDTDTDTEVAAAAKEGDQSTAALPYHFVFYLHQAHAQQQTQQSPQPGATAPHTESVPDGLHKISLTLPPPARKDYAQPDQLPLATQASLGRLLSACGLQRCAC